MVQPKEWNWNTWTKKLEEKRAVHRSLGLADVELELEEMSARVKFIFPQLRK